MENLHAQRIVDGLRSAQGAGGPVVELQGASARSFGFVTETSTVLGSFSVMDGAFFVVVATTYGGNVDFQLRAYKVRAKPVLTTNKANEQGVIWDYSASKQDGNNAARKEAFRKLAGADSIFIPYPSADASEFISAVTRAIELRALAHAAGDEAGDAGEPGDDLSGEPPDASGLLAQLFPVEAERTAAARLLAATIRKAHDANPKSWCVTNPGGEDRIRVNVGVVRVLDLVPGLAMLAVDASKLDEAARASLGNALDLSDDEGLAQFGDNGIATVPARSFASLPENVRVAHEALVERAAASTSPYARHHRPEIVAKLEELLGESLPRPAAPTVHYWKIAPGENAEYWGQWRHDGFIAIGWNKLGDLTNVTHDEFKKLAAEKEASSQVWKFRNIAVGDRVVANYGYFRVLGIGTVTGTYRYVPNAEHAHQIPVRWDDTRERIVSMRGWRSTLIRLDQQTFKEIDAVPVSEFVPGIASAAMDPAREVETELGPEGGIDFEGILANLASKQLSFSAELVASYLLALQAKRFVLLSGISGTGKTRLALEIARLFGPTVESPQDVASSADEVEVIAKPYQIKYGRLVVSSELAQEFDALTDADVKRIDLKLPGLSPQSMALYKNASRGNLFYITLSGDAKEWFRSHIRLGDRFLLSRQTHKDREWLELKLPTAAQRTHVASERRYELIAVRPDWTDARALLGFYNPLTKSYITTPTLKLLLRAHADLQASASPDPRPYFLLFDEMNLARVEHYFSDFLSAMESGEEIHLHDDPQLEDEEDIPRRIKIPKNVFVIGTVNVDETTYMFSPKVLDRAFVLEFNDVDLDGLAGPVQSEEWDSTPLALVNLEGGLKLRGDASGDEWKRFERLLGGEARALFGKIHDALMIENRHFGYRVAREVARFVDLAVDQAGASDATVRAALDVAVLAKVLPKLHGSQSEIEATLKRLMAIATADKPDAEVFTKQGAVIDGVEIPLRRTARKLWRMLHRLAANGFVSFIE
jgi:hypothetical protein